MKMVIISASWTIQLLIVYSSVLAVRAQLVVVLVVSISQCVNQRQHSSYLTDSRDLFKVTSLIQGISSKWLASSSMLCMFMCILNFSAFDCLITSPSVWWWLSSSVALTAGGCGAKRAGSTARGTGPVRESVSRQGWGVCPAGFQEYCTACTSNYLCVYI